MQKRKLSLGEAASPTESGADPGNGVGWEAGLGALGGLAPQKGLPGGRQHLAAWAWRSGLRTTCVWPTLGFSPVTSPTPSTVWLDPLPCAGSHSQSGDSHTVSQPGSSWLQASHPPARWKHQPDVGTVAWGGERKWLSGRPGVQAGLAGFRPGDKAGLGHQGEGQPSSPALAQKGRLGSCPCLGPGTTSLLWGLLCLSLPAPATVQGTLEGTGNCGGRGGSTPMSPA